MSLAGTGTVTNFGTIEGTGLSASGYIGGVAAPTTAVQFGSASDVLIAEGGSTFIGQVIGDGGTLELRGGGTSPGTIDGMNGFGKVAFAAVLRLRGLNTLSSSVVVGDRRRAQGGWDPGTSPAGRSFNLAVATLANLSATTLTGGTFIVGAGATLRLTNDSPIAGPLTPSSNWLDRGRERPGRSTPASRSAQSSAHRHWRRPGPWISWVAALASAQAIASAEARAGRRGPSPPRPHQQRHDHRLWRQCRLDRQHWDRFDPVLADPGLWRGP